MALLSQGNREANALEYIRRQWLIRETLQRILEGVQNPEILDEIEEIYLLETVDRDYWVKRYLAVLKKTILEPDPSQVAMAIVLAETRIEVEACLHQLAHSAFRGHSMTLLLYHQTPWAPSIPKKARLAVLEEIMAEACNLSDPE